MKKNLNNVYRFFGMKPCQMIFDVRKKRMIRGFCIILTVFVTVGSAFGQSRNNPPHVETHSVVPNGSVKKEDDRKPQPQPDAKKTPPQPQPQVKQPQPAPQQEVKKPQPQPPQDAKQPQPSPQQNTAHRVPQRPAGLPDVVSEKDANKKGDDIERFKKLPNEIKRPQRPATLEKRQYAFQITNNAPKKNYQSSGVITKPQVSKLIQTTEAVAKAVGAVTQLYKVVVDSSSAKVSYYRSPKLRADFLEDMDGAKIGAINDGSPLRGTAQRPSGLEVGDIITDLNGIPVEGPSDLEKHTKWTSVDYIDFRTGSWKQTWIYVW